MMGCHQDLNARWGQGDVPTPLGVPAKDARGAPLGAHEPSHPTAAFAQHFWARGMSEPAGGAGSGRGAGAEGAPTSMPALSPP